MTRETESEKKLVDSILLRATQKRLLLKMKLVLIDRNRRYKNFRLNQMTALLGNLDQVIPF